MDWYKRWIGDYARDTKRLSMLEHGAYTLLLDYCYASEEPLPYYLSDLYRITGANTPAERLAVKRVVEKFFPIKGKARRNKRADVEIAAVGRARKIASESGKLGNEKRWRGKDLYRSPDRVPDRVSDTNPTRVSIALQTPRLGEEAHQSSEEVKPGPERVRPGLDPERRTVVARRGNGSRDLESESTRLEKALAMLGATPDFPLGRLADIFHLTVKQLEDARDAKSP